MLSQAQNLLELVRTKLDAPWVGAYVSTLGGKDRPTVMLRISLDPKTTWINGILENSRYAMFSFDYPNQKIQLFSGHGTAKFRKCSFKSNEDALKKIQLWISGHSS